MYVKVWSKVRDDKNKEVDWVLVGYDGNSKTDMTVVDSGSGGMEAVSSKLPEGAPTFGGVRLSTGRFVHFLYIDESCPALKRGRTLMYKNGKWLVWWIFWYGYRFREWCCLPLYLLALINQLINQSTILSCPLTLWHPCLGYPGVFNALEGCDGEIEMSPGLTEATMGQVR